MPLVCQVKHGDWHSVELAIRQIIRQLGPQADAVFASIVMPQLQAGKLVATDVAGKLASTDAGSWVLEGSGVTITSNPEGTVTISVDEEAFEGVGIVEVADAVERVASDARVVYQQDIKKLYLRRA